MPAGTRSETALITNLTNGMMLFIRYDQGDCILLKAGQCACDSAYPAIRVTGRTYDLLNLPRPQQQSAVTVTPLSLVAAIEEVPGAYACRSSTALNDLDIRLQVMPGADNDAV